MLTLHGYWRSSAAYRVRIALNLKGLDYAQVPHDLRRNRHQADDYRALNPQRLVPALDTGEAVLTQSPAILEWLEETHPEPALLPASPQARAIVRSMCALIACDIHPLNNLRVLRELKSDFGADAARLDLWARGWIAEGFTALEVMVEKHGGGFCFGDAPGLAEPEISVGVVRNISDARRQNRGIRQPFDAVVSGAK